MRFVTALARFWWDFVVGDDWRIAVGVVLVLGAGAVLVADTEVPHALVAVLAAVGIALVALCSIVLATRRNAS
ncbi:MAG TPA: hypothetical protein VH834_22320 [Solirubrobacteraceae bacterium]|jgi:hypothetical protein